MRLPRGSFTADGRNPAARRGTMVGYQMEDEDVATLASWGANLIRLQIGGSAMVNAATPEEWFAALSNRLDWCGAVMDRCERHGIKVVLDMHVGPGCAVSKNAANLLPRDYLGHAYDPSDLVRAWRIIASRFRGHPATYGYDILNEPSVEPETWRQICREVIAPVREWPAWDVEYTNDPEWAIGKWMRPGADTARKRELLKGLSRNRCGTVE